MNRFVSAEPFILLVKNSRFLAEMTSADTPEAARAVIALKRAEHPDVSHVVYAFVVGNSGEILGCSDDGEPSGTAGRPALEVLKNCGMTDVILTVIRWFGGTKLGTGGLVHAYSDCAKGVIANAVSEPIRTMREFTFTLPFSLAEQGKRMLPEVEFAISEAQYGGDGLTVTGALPVEHVPVLAKKLADLTRGSIKLDLSTEES